MLAEILSFIKAVIEIFEYKDYVPRLHGIVVKRMGFRVWILASPLNQLCVALVSYLMNIN